MEQNRYGLTSEEREQLANQPHIQERMDVRASLLAFASLLLICILLIAASFIARLHRPHKTPYATSVDTGEPLTYTEEPTGKRRRAEAESHADVQPPKEPSATNSFE